MSQKTVPQETRRAPQQAGVVSTHRANRPSDLLPRHLTRVVHGTGGTPNRVTLRLTPRPRDLAETQLVDDRSPRDLRDGHNLRLRPRPTDEICRTFIDDRPRHTTLHFRAASQPPRGACEERTTPTLLAGPITRRHLQNASHPDRRLDVRRDESTKSPHFIDQ